jgi:hypothetical protein
VEEEDQEIPGGETLLPRWRKRVIDGKIWNVWQKQNKVEDCRQLPMHH